MLKELYNLRWGIETLFSVLKERLKIDNFTGKTVIAIINLTFFLGHFVYNWFRVYINANCWFVSI
jgi:IS4 transposase